MNDFDYENLQKKRIAAGAFHKKNGSKSRGCTLPSDHLTEAERRKLNGPVTTIRLDEPMTWKEFKTLSDEHQRLYVEHLAELYAPSLSMLGEMFGTSGKTVFAHFNKHGLTTGHKRGGSVTDRQRAMWEAFCSGVVGGKPAEDTANLADVILAGPENPQAIEDLLTACKEPAPTETPPSRLTHLDITFENVHSWEELYALLQRFGPIGDRTVRVIVE